jgi:hypothetical protein
MFLITLHTCLVSHAVAVRAGCGVDHALCSREAARSVVFSRTPLSRQFSSKLVGSGLAWWRDEGQRSPHCGDKPSSAPTHHHSSLASRGLATRHDSTPACPGNPSRRGNISGTFITQLDLTHLQQSGFNDSIDLFSNAWFIAMRNNVIFLILRR